MSKHVKTILTSYAYSWNFQLLPSKESQEPTWFTSALPMIKALTTTLRSLDAAINMAVCPILGISKLQSYANTSGWWVLAIFFGGYKSLQTHGRFLKRFSHGVTVFWDSPLWSRVCYGLKPRSSLWWESPSTFPRLQKTLSAWRMDSCLNSPVQTSDTLPNKKLHKKNIPNTQNPNKGHQPKKVQTSLKKTLSPTNQPTNQPGVSFWASPTHWPYWPVPLHWSTASLHAADPGWGWWVGWGWHP